MCTAPAAKRRIYAILTTTVTAAALLGTASTAQAACANGSTTNVASAGAAARCLVNAERAAHGLGPMRSSAKLRVAALRHSRDMVARNYFSHVSPTGSTMAQRVRGAGFLKGAADYALGENIAWGSGVRSTPASIVQSWMASPGHRAVILNGRLDEIGIGVTGSAPGGGAGATYVMNAGMRG